MLILFAVDSEIPKTGRHVVRNVLLQDRAGARVRIAPIEELLLALIFLRHHPVDALSISGDRFPLSTSCPIVGYADSFVIDCSEQPVLASGDPWTDTVFFRLRSLGRMWI